MSKQQEQFDFLREHIGSSEISALLLAKIREAEENHITCTIDPDTTLTQVKEAAVDALITIIGNLLQNSIEALKEDQHADKYVSILIKHDSDQVLIHVQDNGPGIPTALSQLIFNSGFTTKEESGNRGYGLYLVKRHVQNLDGRLSTCTHNGTHFSVSIPADRVLRSSENLSFIY
jgi:sensor histidine kinase regulating citrate/malate metabolism